MATSTFTHIKIGDEAVRLDSGLENGLYSAVDDGAIDDAVWKRTLLFVEHSKPMIAKALEFLTHAEFAKIGKWTRKAAEDAGGDDAEAWYPLNVAVFRAERRLIDSIQSLSRSDEGAETTPQSRLSELAEMLAKHAAATAAEADA